MILCKIVFDRFSLTGQDAWQALTSNGNGNDFDASTPHAACPAPPDFLDLADEWRRLFAEAWGTFLFVVVAAGAGVVVVQSNCAITLSMKVGRLAVMVMAIIYFMGTVSGAHLNPAVTLAFAARRNFPWCPGTPGGISRRSSFGGIVAAWSSPINVRH